MDKSALEALQSRINLSLPEKYVPWKPSPHQAAFLLIPHKEAMYGGSAGGGKAAAHSTPVLTPRGWVTHGDLSVGDYVFDENGNPVEIIAVSGEKYTDTYQVNFVDGESIKVNAEHLWNVSTGKDRDNYANTDPAKQAKRRANRESRARDRDESAIEGMAKGSMQGRTEGNSESSKLSNSMRAAKARETKVRPSVWEYTSTVDTLTLKDMVETASKRLSVPVGGALQGEHSWASNIPPYVMGYWLGDGTSCNGEICVGEEDNEELLKQLDHEGWGASLRYAQVKSSGNKVRYYKVYSPEGVELSEILSTEGLLGNKHVPSWVVSTSFADRQAFLGGFLDSDGHVDERGRIQFCLSSKEMVESVHTIIWSMGIPATSVKHRTTKNQTPGFKGDAWRFEVSQCPEYLFRFPRKANILRENTKGKRNYVGHRYIDSVVKVEDEPMKCIKVASERGLYRVGTTHVVTHNSVAILQAALQYVDHPNYSALLLRRTFRDLAQPGALIDLSMEWLKPTDARWNEQKKRWIFPSGAVLQFGHMESENDKTNYQGAAYQFVGFDELTQFTERMYTYLFSRMRKGKENDIPIRMRSTANPGGIGHQWVYDRFIRKVKEEDLTSAEKKKRDNRIFIPSSLHDNPHLDKEDYVESLMELDPVTRAQLMNGDWEVQAEGNMFRRQWFDGRIVDSLPPGVQIRRSVRYWDLASTDEEKAIKEKGDPDYTASVLQVLGTDGNIYVMEITRDRLSPAGVENLVRSIAHRDGRSNGTVTWMEQEPGSSGVNTVHSYRKLLLGFNFRSERPTGNKVERARTASATCENGMVYLVKGAHTEAFLDELQAFPTGAHDDMVDAFAAGLNKIAESADIGVARDAYVRPKKRGIWD